MNIKWPFSYLSYLSPVIISSLSMLRTFIPQWRSEIFCKFGSFVMNTFSPSRDIYGMIKITMILQMVRDIIIIVSTTIIWDLKRMHWLVYHYEYHRRLYLELDLIIVEDEHLYLCVKIQWHWGQTWGYHHCHLYFITTTITTTTHLRLCNWPVFCRSSTCTRSRGSPSPSRRGSEAARAAARPSGSTSCSSSPWSSGQHCKHIFLPWSSCQHFHWPHWELFAVY